MSGFDTFRGRIQSSIACRKLQSWDDANWDFLAKDLPYGSPESDDRFDVLVADLEHRLVEVDIVGYDSQVNEYLRETVQELEDWGYRPGHKLPMDIDPELRDATPVPGRIFYSEEDEWKMSTSAAEDFDRIFGYDVFEAGYEMINPDRCAAGEYRGANRL
ncbi:MAG: hypothetical protein ABEI58_02685 [Candidatus Nanohaloarchaea archaeon]